MSRNRHRPSRAILLASLRELALGARRPSPGLNEASRRLVELCKVMERPP
jgi:hypothetical protein